MTLPMGSTITAIVTDLNEHEAFAQYQGITYRVVDAHQKTVELGDTVRGLIYENQKDEKLLLQDIPQALTGDYVWAEVIETKRGLGAFVDIGLPEKDVLVSLDVLPHLPSLWPQPGDHLLVTARFDKKGQLWGQLLNQDGWELRVKPAPKNMHNQDFEATVVLLQKAGTYIMLDSGILAFIHPSERIEEPRLGQRITGRVIGRRDEKILYASTKPRAHEVIADDAVMIYETMKRMPGQRLELTNKSAPEAINFQFAISKGRFKRAIGHLMKKDLVDQDDRYTFLL